MSDENLDLFFLIESKGRWKEVVATLKEQMESTAEYIGIERCGDYSHWKLIHFKRDSVEISLKVIEEYLHELDKLQLSNCIIKVTEGYTGETQFYRLYNGEIVSCNELNLAITEYFDANRDFHFFDNIHKQDKLVIKFKPKTKTLLKNITPLLERHKSENSIDSFTSLKNFIDEQALKAAIKDGLTSTFDFPNYQPTRHSKVYQGPLELPFSLKFVHEQGGVLYIGLQFDDLAKYTNDRCNQYNGCSDPHVANLIEIFAFISTQVVAKARVGNLSTEGLEAYFSYISGVLYYFEQQFMPEMIWSQGTVPIDQQDCYCDSGRKHKDCFNKVGFDIQQIQNEGGKKLSQSEIVPLTNASYSFMSEEQLSLEECLDDFETITEELVALTSKFQKKNKVFPEQIDSFSLFKSLSEKLPQESKFYQLLCEYYHLVGSRIGHTKYLGEAVKYFNGIYAFTLRLNDKFNEKDISDLKLQLINNEREFMDWKYHLEKD